MSRAESIRLVALGILGIVLAASFGALASKVTTQPVGITEEPVSVGKELVAGKDRLAPERKPNHRTGKRRPAQDRADDPPQSAAAPAPTTPGADDTTAVEPAGDSNGPGTSSVEDGSGEYEPPEVEDDD